MVFGLFKSRRDDASPAEARAGVPACVPPGTTVYVIGDIHGCAGLLGRIHDQILIDAESRPTSRKVAVYLGDYIDRGPESRQVIDMLLDAPLEGFECHHLCGNHEAWMLQFLEDPAAGPGWFANGGLATLVSYGVGRGGGGSAEERLAQTREALVERLPVHHRTFLENLSLTHIEGDYLFVHAGLRPGVPLEAQSPDDMLWIREEFLFADADFGKTVVHGHTIVREPEVAPARIAIDTGAFATGTLTCLVLEGDRHDFLTT